MNRFENVSGLSDKTTIPLPKNLIGYHSQSRHFYEIAVMLFAFWFTGALIGGFPTT